MVNNRVDINSVLMQMRQVKDQLRTEHQQQQGAQKPQELGVSELDQVRSARLENQVAAVQETSEVGDSSVPSFQTMFKNAVNNVNEQQQVANNLATRFEQGDASIDLPEVMIALQKSNVSFQAMTQVRNKLVDAYKEIMNMPV